MKQSASNYNSVLETVQSWTPEQRSLLIADLIKTLPRNSELDKDLAENLPVDVASSVELALGLLSTDAPAPSDEEVAKWIEERRQNKYR